MQFFRINIRLRTYLCFWLSVIALCSFITIVNLPSADEFRRGLTRRFRKNFPGVAKKLLPKTRPIRRQTAVNISRQITDSNSLKFVGMRKVEGKTFSSEWIPFLCRFKLDSAAIEAINDEDVLSSFPTFVTAVSNNHFLEIQQLIYSISKYFPDRTLWLYDIGLSVKNREKLERCPGIEVKDFDFNKFPYYVRHLREYRFKPLVVAHALASVHSVWWLDASSMFHTKDLSHVLTRVGASGDDVDNSKTRRRQVRPFQLFLKTFHSNFAVLNEGMLDYFPSPEERLKMTTQYAASTYIVYATKWARKNILKWWILCALEKDCMAPGGSSGGREMACYFRDYFGIRACHRYDQVAINLILLHRNNFNMQDFVTPLNGVLSWDAGRIHPFTCWEKKIEDEDLRLLNDVDPLEL